MWRMRHRVPGPSVRSIFAILLVWAIWSAMPTRPAHHAWAQTDSLDPVTLLLTAEDAGAVATLTKENQGEDGQSRWARRRWERDRESPDATSGALVLENAVFVTRDIAMAKQVYAAEVAKSESVPEATDRHTGPYTFPMMPIGDESAALSVCNDCNAKDDVYVHHRAVVRKGPVVTVIYTYGTDGVATQDLATWFAGQAVSRIPNDIKVAETAPTTGEAATAGVATASSPESGTSAAALPAAVSSGGQVVTTRPQDLAIMLAEAGKSAERKEEKDGSDDRSAWYLVRYERPRTYAGYRAGPVTVYSQVFVARDRQAADQIFQEQVQKNEEFPEAKEKVGGRFELKESNEIGDESRGLSACNTSCNSDKEIYLHKRLVARVENVVSVIYIWGLANEEGVTDASARYFASLVAARVRD
jgi:hypothetical protein